jgi:leucyl aminopeptidase
MSYAAAMPATAKKRKPVKKHTSLKKHTLPLADLPTGVDVRVTTSESTKPGTCVVAAAGRVDGKASLLADLAMLPEDARGALQQLIDDGSATGRPGDVATAVSGRRVILVGVGEVSHDDRVGQMMKFGAAVARAGRRLGVDELAVVPPRDEDAADVVTGFVVGSFEPSEGKGTATPKPEAWPSKLTVLGGDDASVREAAAVATAQNYARTVAYRPGNSINPATLAEEAERLAEATGLTCRVIDAKKAERLGMGGLLAVGQGSMTPPCMIVLEHNAAGGKGKKKDKTPPLLVIGKAITFDTGGISIKPSANMQSMVFDKCGGMAVLGFMAAVAAVGLDRPVVGVLAAAENMPAHNAYRPGDILTMYNGVTVEVTNTDAEGRLVLADALAWGIGEYKPSACVDLATLTGAAVVALGLERAGAWSNDNDLFVALEQAGRETGEKYWRMPLGPEYREALKSNVADIVNAPGRWGGACTAAEFLHHFVPGNIVGGGPEVPWCHLDIAPTADSEKDQPPYVKGATGFGVRTLLRWAKDAPR